MGHTEGVRPASLLDEAEIPVLEEYSPYLL